MTANRYPRLAAPPINEVVCGFLFHSIPQLTPAQHGVYWTLRRETFPKHEVQPAIQDPVDVVTVAAVLPLRTLLIGGENDTRVIQLQHDRFFANWRKRKETDAYPRFHEYGNEPGLLKYSLGEFKKFEAFCQSLGGEPKVTHVELSKIDVLAQPLHWKDLDDLGRLLPWASSSIGLRLSEKPNFMLQFDDTVIPETKVRVVAGTGVMRDSGDAVVRLESTLRMPIRQGIEYSFDELNTRANDVFFGLIPKSELARFSVKETT